MIQRHELRDLRASRFSWSSRLRVPAPPTALARESALLDELFRGLLEELMTGRVPVQPIIARPQQPWGMFEDDPKKYHWVLQPHEYTDLGELLGDLQAQVIAPAEAKAKQLAAR